MNKGNITFRFFRFNDKDEVLIDTSFGEVPYTVIKSYLSRDLVQMIQDEIRKHKKEKLKKEVDKKKEELITAEKIIKGLAKRLNTSPISVGLLIDTLDEVQPSLSFSLLLRQVAIMIDSRYKDHIEDSKEIWAISTSDGKVFKLDKSAIKNYKNFAAFRSKEDAMEAHRILSKRIRKMFRSSGK